MNVNDVALYIKEFRGKPYNNEVLEEFSKRYKVEPISADNLGDAIQAYEYDERMEEVLPLIFAELSKLNHIYEYDSEAKAKIKSEENAEIERSIAVICEKKGIHYSEIGFLTKLGDTIKGLLNNTEHYISNMGARVLAEMALTHIGDPLTVNILATKHREIANEKAKRKSTKALPVADVAENEDVGEDVVDEAEEAEEEEGVDEADEAEDSN